MTNRGTGRIAPLDTPEFIEVGVTVENGEITDSSYACSEGEYVRDCAQTVARVILGRPFADVMQMNGNAVIYNTERDLPRSELYLASMAVMAAKRAVSDYARKNGIELSGDDCCCG